MKLNVTELRDRITSLHGIHDKLFFRFAQFVGGEAHITDDEVSLYEDDIYPDLPEISDDEDDEIDFRLSSQ